jgi:hypothetical protein
MRLSDDGTDPPLAQGQSFRIKGDDVCLDAPGKPPERERDDRRTRERPLRARAVAIRACPYLAFAVEGKG